MRVMIDTNVLLSALIFESTKLAELIEYITEEHHLVLCSYVIEEAKEVIGRKSSNYIAVLDGFLLKISFEMVYTPSDVMIELNMRDAKDIPVIVSAIASDVDILITGDKDFADLDIERPEILTPTEFLNKY